MIKEFVERWKNCGDEKSDTQKFWLELLHDVLGVENPGALIDFEKRVTLEHKSFIDAYITETRVLIEQKSYGIDLTKWATQSDGFLLTPFEQAKRYADWLPDSEHPRWIVICNFQEFHVHDMEFPKAPPEIIRLEDLESDARKLLFLVNPKAATPKEIRELQISEQAGELVGKLYDALLTCYTDPNSPESQRSLNILCVRIVFLLYAEDSGLFKKGQFHDYILAHKDSSRRALMDLFTVLSQELDERDKYTDEDLMAFPYVNGGLFEEANIEIPQLTTPKAAPRMPYSPHPPR